MEQKEKECTHTPGPWRVGKAYGAVVSDNLVKGMEHFTEDDLGSAGYGGYLICESTNKANAKLISAAPDLLEVARLCLKEWEEDSSGQLPGHLIARLSNYADLARAAIKKVEGE